jgi:hypothetical protein
MQPDANMKPLENQRDRRTAETVGRMSLNVAPHPARRPMPDGLGERRRMPAGRRRYALASAASDMQPACGSSAI